MRSPVYPRDRIVSVFETIAGEEKGYVSRMKTNWFESEIFRDRIGFTQNLKDEIYYIVKSIILFQKLEPAEIIAKKI